MGEISRNTLRCSASAAAILLGATSAFAQTAPTETAPPPEQVADIVVTGSRIESKGYAQPTPTTTMSTADLEKTAQPNIFVAVAQIPALLGSTGSSVEVNNTSTGRQGLSSFSLRGLGTIRTLTLIDGQRVVGANYNGVADVSLFPQMLIKRVDVVTGGASASYGSDAVGGVVNFITDTRFTGFKANVTGGETTYGDGRNGAVQAAWGGQFLGDRLHVQVSGEYAKDDGVGPGAIGGAGPGGRTWYDAAALFARPLSSTGDGRPQYLIATNAQNYTFAQYGLIVSGPLRGTAFNANGTTYPFAYGTNAPELGGVSACGFGTGADNAGCVGGDLSANTTNTTSLASAVERKVGYGRVGFDLDNDNEIYATVNMGWVDSSNVPSAAPLRRDLRIQCSNAFLPASVGTACAQNNITSFLLGTTNASFPNPTVRVTREQQRYAVGAKGKFEIGDNPISYSIYYQHGINKTKLRVTDMYLTNRYINAVDAVFDPVSNSIVCRNVAARSAGCQPLNIFGAGASAAALSYIYPENGPFQNVRQTQDVASANFTAEVFELPAGPLAVATGVEYRREAFVAIADTYGNGIAADSPISAEYPNDPVLNLVSGGNYPAGNYRNGRGSYNVKEAYLEVNAPLIDSESLGKANLNVAGRVTHYSTSGTVFTWKVGGTWATPVDGIRLRGVTSRDIRAPNLSDLYAPRTSAAGSVNNGSVAVPNVQFISGGNPNLKPEVARSTELGIALANPSWLPGLTVSIDYYKIKLDDAIGPVGSAQLIVDLCNAGNQDLCTGVFLNSTNPGTPNYVRATTYNLASISTKGFDIEAAYRQRLGESNSLTVRVLATHVISYRTNSGVAGNVPVESAGVNVGAVPNWKLLASESLDAGKFNLTLFQRWISSGVYSNEYVECQTNCPVSTLARPTIYNNHIAGAFYVDVGGSYSITKNVQAYFKVDNVFDKSPPLAPVATGPFNGANPSLYDVLGRMYRIGARFNF